MDSFGDTPPQDVLIEREVDRAIREGFPLPRWGWKTPGPYQGSTGTERVQGWQKVRIAEMLGLLPPRGRCSGCGEVAEHRHTELYRRPLFSLGVCRSCHLHVHRRFARPDRWQNVLKGRIEPQSWFRAFSLAPMSRQDAVGVASEADLVSALRRFSEAQRADRRR